MNGEMLTTAGAIPHARRRPAFAQHAGAVRTTGSNGQ
jgi:hypothetical protein